MSLSRFGRLFGLGVGSTLAAGAGFLGWRQVQNVPVAPVPVIPPPVVEEMKPVVRIIKADPNYVTMNDYEAYWLAALKENGLFLKHIPRAFVTDEMIIAAYNQNPKALQYYKHIPDTAKLTNFYEKIVKENILNLIYCSDTFKVAHPQLCQKLFEIDHQYYHSIPSEAVTDTMKKQYIKLSGRLELIKDKTVDYYVEVLKQNVLTLRYRRYDIPENLREEIIAKLPEDIRKKAKFLLAEHYKLDWATCKEVLDLDAKYLEYVPEYFWRDNDDIIKYVKKEPSLIKSITSVFDIDMDKRERYDHYGRVNGHKFTKSTAYDNKVGKTVHNPQVLKFYAHVVAEAVSAHPASLEHVQNADLLNTLLDENLAFKMWEDAVSKNGSLLRFVPQEIRVNFPSICDKALAETPMAMQYIPQNQLTKEKCAEAFDRNQLCYNYIPRAFVTKEMSERAVLLNPMALEKVPVEHQSEMMWFDAAIHNPYVIKQRFTPNTNLVTGAVYMAAFSKNHSIFTDLPLKYRTASMCEMMMKEDARKYYEHVPDDLKTEAMTLAYITSNSEYYDRPDLKKVPMDLRTQQVCDLAFARYIRNFTEIPEDKKTEAMTRVYATVYPESFAKKVVVAPEPERNAVFRRN